MPQGLCLPADDYCRGTAAQITALQTLTSSPVCAWLDALPHSLKSEELGKYGICKHNVTCFLHPKYAHRLFTMQQFLWAPKIKTSQRVGPSWGFEGSLFFFFEWESHWRLEFVFNTLHRVVFLFFCPPNVSRAGFLISFDARKYLSANPGIILWSQVCKLTGKKLLPYFISLEILNHNLITEHLL